MPNLLKSLSKNQVNTCFLYCFHPIILSVITTILLVLYLKILDITVGQRQTNKHHFLSWWVILNKSIKCISKLFSYLSILERWLNNPLPPTIFCISHCWYFVILQLVKGNTICFYTSYTNTLINQTKLLFLIFFVLFFKPCMPHSTRWFWKICLLPCFLKTAFSTLSFLSMLNRSIKCTLDNNFS